MMTYFDSYLGETLQVLFIGLTIAVVKDYKGAIHHFEAWHVRAEQDRERRKAQ